MSVATSIAELLPSRSRDAGTQLHVARGLARTTAFTLHNMAAMGWVFPERRLRPTPAEAAELRRRLTALFTADWRNVEEGLYPEALARGFSWARFLSAYPRLVRDAPRFRRRVRSRVHDELPADARRFPSYYQRNFHFQSQGYLGLESAALYEAQVEILFAGTADAMRRQVLPPIVRALRGRDPASARVLDLACGTGSMLRMLAQALPGVGLYGCDLSPHYIAHARRTLADIVPLSLVAENAERLPFVDGFFDAVTCVYLFHELPPAVRDRALAEAARIIAPGGLFVLADSVQWDEAPELHRHLRRFSEQFHEPFFAQYLRDDLTARLDRAGFEVIDISQHFVTKVITSKRRIAMH